jgi:broad specificity phosphatase PhoE
VLKNGLQINSDDWDICYCSKLPRAVKTAETVFNKEIIKTDLIVEVPITPFTKRNFKLPAIIWQIGARIAWYKSYRSQIESIHGTRERINEFYKVIENSGYNNILIVSHGYFLRMFYEEMKKKGFEGEVEVNIKNGKLYTLEN